MEAVKRKEKKVVSVHPLVLKCDTSLKDHKELDEPINTEEAKNIELDEQPKPTRKVTNPSGPVSDEPTSRGHKTKREKQIRVFL